MRRTLIGVVAAGALVLGACGDDDDSSASDDGSSGDFCTTMEELVTAASNDESDPEAAQETLSNLEPPAEIADEWEQYVPLITRGGDIDPNDPEAQAEYQEELQNASEAGAAINRYLEEECGLTEDTSSGGDTETTETTEGSGQ
jgi:hypothetical protein